MWFCRSAEHVIVPGGKVADVQRIMWKLHGRIHLSLREEPIGDAALIEDLDGARVQPASAARAPHGFLAGAPLDNGDIDARQRQLARQHQPCRAASGDHHRMVPYRHIPVVFAATVNAIARGEPIDCIHVVTRVSVSVAACTG